VSPNIVRNYLNMIATSKDCILKSNCKYPIIQGNDRINGFLLTITKKCEQYRNT